ncbi:MAG: hypothetical protein ACYC6Y_04735 [Thermoguttaceae bacterium]
MNQFACPSRPPVRGPSRRRPGQTLVELVAALTATSILLAGMGSVVIVAVRSTNDDALPMRQVQAGVALHEILADVQFALSFTRREGAALEFTVADRNGDGTAETLCYSWSGTPGDPLKRQYNGGPDADFLPNVHAFAYSDRTKTATSWDGVQTLHVYQCDFVLQAGDDASTRIVGLAKIYNVPEVAAP